MGYRSEVSYIISFASQEKLDTFVALQVCKKDEVITQALKDLRQIQTTGDEKMLYFYANDVKWYDDYEDVKVHHMFMEEAMKMHEDSAWLFLRCGEQNDDTQEDSDGIDAWDLYDYISISRPTIETDVGITKPIMNEEGELV
jgi:hypothetical protein